MAFLAKDGELGVHALQVVHYLGGFSTGIGSQKKVVMDTEVLENLPALRHLHDAISHPLVRCDLCEVLAFKGNRAPISRLQPGDSHQEG